MGPEDELVTARVFGALPVPAWILDASGRTIAVNAEVVRTLGWAPSAVVGHAPGELAVAPSRGALAALVRRRDGIPKEWRLRAAGGAVVPVRLTAVPLVHGRAETLLLADDVTGEHASRGEAGLLRGVLEAADAATVTVDLDGAITGWSEAAGRLFGKPAAEMLGRPLEAIFPGALGAFASRVMRVLRAGQRIVSLQTRARRSDGRIIDVVISAAPGRDALGGVNSAILMLQDVTEQREMERRLREGEKMEAVGRLAGGVAHDFNNILTAILGFADVLLTEVDDPDARADATEVRRAAERGAALTRQLLAFSRRQVLHASVVALNDVVSELQPLLVRLLGERVDLVMGLDPGAGHVRADPSQLEQVLVNLVVNARDAMPEGGRILVETAGVEVDERLARMYPPLQPDRYAVLAVSDEGEGIAEEVKEHLFEPFFTTKGRGKGTGLGLATVYGIVAQSDGQIVVHSEPGLGTTFRVYLPLVATPPRARPKPVRDASQGRGGSVLLVEDDDSLRTLTARVLREAGYEVVAAADGDAALGAAAAADGWDVVVTDVVMPGRNGPEVVRELRRRRPDLPALFVSGYPDADLAATGALPRRSAFLAKPFTPEALLAAISDVMEGRAPRSPGPHEPAEPAEPASPAEQAEPAKPASPAATLSPDAVDR